ncbi:hypothetical protein [Kribbella catacumbae]|uniref:hypothetical protein n=1 Tax=Kribbella catacumbae TaxID=460086 RepID=UPI00037B698C|nr:hypothetical protein [Kribbella catacumbae]
MDFDALQQRNVNSAAAELTQLVATRPASFKVFDILAVDCTDVDVINRRRRQLP